MRSKTLQLVSASLALALASWLASCASSRPSHALDKKTDWLGSCQQTDECSDGLECVRGLCTTRCSARSACSKYSADAICASVSVASECVPSSTAVRSELACTLACERRSECSGRNDALLCVASACAIDPCEVGAPDDGGRPDGAISDGGPIEDNSGPPRDGGGTAVGMQPTDADVVEDASSSDPVEDASSSGPVEDASSNDPKDPDGGSTACIGANEPGPLSDDGFAPTAVMLEASLTKIPVLARALASDLSRGRLYALATASDPEYPSQLVVLSSEDGAVIEAIDVGSDPSALAITDDESTLWVGSESDHQIREIDLGGELPALVASYALPAEWLPRQPMIIVPPATVAEARPPLIDFRTMDDGNVFIGQVTLSPGAAIASAASGRVAARVAAGPPGWFFAYNDSSSGYDFYSIDGTSNGLEQRTTAPYWLLQGSERGIVYDRDGFVYADSGEVIDVRNPAAPRRAGAFAYGGKHLPIPDSDLVLVVASSSRSVELLHLLDTATFSRVSWLRVPFGFESLSSPVALGRDRAAFIGTSVIDTAVYLTPAIATEAPVSKIAPMSAAEGSIEVPVAARALVMDHARGVLYAAVGSGAPAYENRVITIEPDTGEIIDSVPVGAAPIALALSDDASVLWVSLAASYQVRRITLPCTGAPIAGPEYALPYGVSSPRLFPIAGRPNSVAAQVSRSTAFFDDGVLRPGFGEQTSGASSMVAGPPGVLFAYDADMSNYGFYTVLYDDEGVTSVAHGELVSGFNKVLSYDPDGFVYTSTGDVIDVRDPLNPSFVGTFEITANNLGAILPLPGPFAIYASGGTYARLDASTMRVGLMTRTACNSALVVADLVHVGPGRIAFIDRPPASLFPGNGMICIVTNPAVIP